VFHRRGPAAAKHRSPKLLFERQYVVARVFNQGR